MKTPPALLRGFAFLFLSLSILTLAATNASSQIIYDNGVGTTGKGYYADGAATSGYDVAAGDVFTTTGGGTVNAVDFSGEFYSNSPDVGDSFALNLYAASTDTGPGSLIVSDSLSSYNQTAVGTHTVGGTGAVLTVYQFDGALVTPFTLSSGTTYYFSISDLTSPAPDNFAVTVTDAGAVPAGASSSEYSPLSGGAGYQTANATLAFQLKDEVIPEPSEWALLLSGGVGLVLARRFMRRAS